MTPNVTQPAVTSAPAQIPDADPSTGTTVTTGTRKSRARCYSCGVVGHIDRACPYKKKGRCDDEVHPSPPADPPRSSMSTLIEEDVGDGRRNNSYQETDESKRPCTKLCPRPLSKLVLEELMKRSTTLEGKTRFWVLLCTLI